VSEGAVKKEERPRKFQAIRGTRDLLPPETARWNRVERTAHEVFATFGFGEIRTPIFEQIEIFARSIGARTDVVTKEMYTLPDRLTPELESLFVSICRGQFLRTKDAKDFAENVAEFATLLNAAQESEVIPSTPRNKTLIQSIGTFSKQTVKEWNEQDFAIDQAKFSALQNYLVSYTRDLELGPILTLRPEATASVCRAYIEHNMQQLPQPVKMYYLGPMFRRERPQKGRYRQFYQIGAEVLGGTDAPAIDAEVIEMVMTFFSKLELRGVELSINSIGDRNCRPKYVELLRTELQKVKDKLGADSQRRIETNPLRVLDSKLENEQALIEKLPRIGDHLCKDCADHYAAVKRELDLRSVKYHENWRLVRGLDYYMRTTFEITAKGLGSQNAVCGGGRYDGLVELLGGPPTKGIGFAIGEDRLILSLQDGGKAPVQQGRDVYIAWMGEKAHETAIRAAKNLRNAGFSVELPPVEQKFGKALGQADKLGARFALILGDHEVASGEWTLKTLADGSQLKLPEPALIEHLRKSKAVSS
jgi:histidyl-tRNA synthetase